MGRLRNLKSKASLWGVWWAHELGGVNFGDYTGGSGWGALNEWLISHFDTTTVSSTKRAKLVPLNNSLTCENKVGTLKKKVGYYIHLQMQYCIFNGRPHS